MITTAREREKQTSISERKINILEKKEIETKRKSFVLGLHKWIVRIEG